MSRIDLFISTTFENLVAALSCLLASLSFSTMEQLASGDPRPVWQYLLSSPLALLLFICASVCVTTRLYSGSRQSRSSQYEQGTPITHPYWLPYVGHAPMIATGFDLVLAQAR